MRSPVCHHQCGYNNEKKSVGVKETKWKVDRTVNMCEGFKMLHAGGDGKTNGVGVITNEEYSKEVIRVER